MLGTGGIASGPGPMREEEDELDMDVGDEGMDMELDMDSGDELDLDVGGDEGMDLDMGGEDESVTITRSELEDAVMQAVNSVWDTLSGGGEGMEDLGGEGGLDDLGGEPDMDAESELPDMGGEDDLEEEGMSEFYESVDRIANMLTDHPDIFE